MSWRAWPEGHPYDLETLGELFGEGDPLVAADSSGRYYLESSALLDLDGQLDDDAAEVLVRHMNGAARAVYRGFRPVHRGQYTAPDGTVHIVGKGGISLRLQENEAFETVKPVSPAVPGMSRGSRYLKLAEQDESVATALRILGRPEPLDWYDLYKLWEIVEHAAGGTSQVVAQGWATKGDIGRFCGDAVGRAGGGQRTADGAQGDGAGDPVGVAAGGGAGELAGAEQAQISWAIPAGDCERSARPGPRVDIFEVAVTGLAFTRGPISCAGCSSARSE